MSHIVGILRSNSAPQAINQSILDILNVIQFQGKESIQNVAIKPNLSYYWGAATGQTTDYRIVAGIIHWLRDHWGPQINIKVVEADASGMRTKWAFKVLGYEQLATKLGIELVNLSEGAREECSVTVGGQRLTFQIPQLLTETDLFINVPKLKTLYSGNPPVTCALKNIFGCIATRRKIKYHPVLTEAIIGINKVLQPHLTVVDGLVALGSTPYKAGIIMAGVNSFAVDEWWFDRSKSGGGALKDLGYHLIDLFQHFVGDCRVETCSLNHYLNLPVEDGAIVILQSLESDIKGILNLGWYQKTVFPKYNFRMILHGTAGYLSSDELIPQNLYTHAMKEGLKNLLRRLTRKPVRALAYTYWYESYYRELHEFFECIRGDTEPFISAQDGLKTIAVIDQAYEIASSRIPHPIQVE